MKIRGRRRPLPTTAGILHLDMLQQLLAPQLTKMTKEEAITSSKMAHPLVA
jgi:hypothetical protein